MRNDEKKESFLAAVLGIFFIIVTIVATNVHPILGAIVFVVFFIATSLIYDNKWPWESSKKGIPIIDTDVAESQTAESRKIDNKSEKISHVVDRYQNRKPEIHNWQDGEDSHKLKEILEGTLKTRTITELSNYYFFILDNGTCNISGFQIRETGGNKVVFIKKFSEFESFKGIQLNFPPFDKINSTGDSAIQDKLFLKTTIEMMKYSNAALKPHIKNVES